MVHLGHMEVGIPMRLWSVLWLDDWQGGVIKACVALNMLQLANLSLQPANAKGQGTGNLARSFTQHPDITAWQTS